MLKIKNPNNIKGMDFVDGRYTLHRVEEQDDRYIFEFRDNVYMEWKLVEVYRKPIWHSERAINMYEINNRTGKDHKVSAEWFGEIKNMKWTFNQALNDL